MSTYHGFDDPFYNGGEPDETDFCSHPRAEAVRQTGAGLYCGRCGVPLEGAQEGTAA